MPVDFGLYSQKSTATSTPSRSMYSSKRCGTRVPSSSYSSRREGEPYWAAHSLHDSFRVGRRAAWTWASMRGMPSSMGSRSLGLLGLGVAGSQDHIRGPFADHDARRVCVDADDGWHDGGVGDPEALDAVDPELGVDDRLVVGADPAGAYRMIVRPRSPGDEVAQFRLVLDVLASEHLAGAPLGEGARGVQFASLLDAEQEPLHIRVLAEVVRVYQRCGHRVGAREPDPSAAAGDGGEPEGVTVGRGLKMWRVERNVDEHELHVGADERWVAAPQHRGLGVVGGAWRYLTFRLEDEAEQGVVVEVLPDAGQLVDHIDPDFAEVFGRADPGEEQKLRRIDGAGRDDHFSFGRRGLDASGSLILDPGAALAVEGQPSGVGVGVYREVRPVDGGVQVGGCGALALAVSDGQLVPARTLLHRAVEVVGGRVAEFLGRVEEDLRERVRVLCYLGAHGATGPPVLGVPAFDGLHLLEVWQDALVVPAGRADGGPAVEVVAVAAQVDHRVDGARPTENLAARPVVREIACPWLGSRLVSPVDFRAPMSWPRGWEVKVLLSILATGLEQQHIRVTFAQARRQYATCRPRPDHHVVVVTHRALLAGPCGLSSPLTLYTTGQSESTTLIHVGSRLSVRSSEYA